MKKDKTVKLVLTPPKLPGLEVPEEYKTDPTLQLLYNIYITNRRIIDYFEENFKSVEDYLYVEESVTNTDSKTYNIVNNLGRVSKSGFITNDGSDYILVSINGKDYIKLKSGETLEWGLMAYKLSVRKMTIKTDSSSAQSFRLLAT